MIDNVYCTVSQREQANAAIARMQRLGFRPEDVIVANQQSDIEALIHTESDSARSTLAGVAYGFAAGVLLGLAQLFYIGHGIWSMWGVPMIPVFSGLGWALIGSIIGCSGLLVARKIPAKVEHRFEEGVAAAKYLLMIPLHSNNERSAVRDTLKDVGASDIYFSGDAA